MYLVASGEDLVNNVAAFECEERGDRTAKFASLTDW